VAGISETCSVCTTSFEVQFRYQMEERDGGFSFFCTQRCLEASQRAGAAEGVICDACSKRFSPDLVSQVLYVGRQRRYACSASCRTQLLREAGGARLGEFATGELEAATPPPEAANAVPSPAVPAVAVSLAPEVLRAPRAREPAVAPTPRVIAVFNHKGGTGKTTTSVSLAAGLASRGKRVLLVDTDAQGNVGVSLGATAERSLYHVLVMGLRVSDATKTVRPNLDLLPSNETLAAAELYLAGRQNRDRVLSERLAQASADYDFVVLDCSPSLSLMNQNALVFADSVLVPVACDYLSLVGVRQVIKTVKNVNALLHHPVQIWGVLPTFFDSRAKICHEAVSTLRGHFGDRCLSPIRAAIKVKEAPAQAQTIFEYASGTNAADDYAAMIDRVLAARDGASEQIARTA
jgi:chromosome partitioning protein